MPYHIVVRTPGSGIAVVCAPITRRLRLLTSVSVLFYRAMSGASFLLSLPSSPFRTSFLHSFRMPKKRSTTLCPRMRRAVSLRPPLASVFGSTAVAVRDNSIATELCRRPAGGSRSSQAIIIRLRPGIKGLSVPIQHEEHVHISREEGKSS